MDELIFHKSLLKLKKLIYLNPYIGTNKVGKSQYQLHDLEIDNSKLYKYIISVILVSTRRLNNFYYNMSVNL